MAAPRLVVLWTITIVASLLAGFGFRSVLAQQDAAQGSVAGLPSDIYPDSFARAPLPKREDLKTEEEKKAFDVVAGPEGLKPGPIPPNNLRLYFPIAADHYRTAIRWLREQSGVEPKYAELAILVAVREAGGQYEWTAHEASAVKAGISQQTVELVRNKADAKGLPEKEAVIIRFGREMHRQQTVSSKTFADAERLFGRKGTLATAIIMAHYSASSMLLHAYDAHWDPAKKPPFPVP
jgi:4-carboxymuconolactone decarboxylase